TQNGGTSLPAPFKVTDRDGTVVAQIEAAKAGGGQLSLYDDKGRLVAQAGMGNRGGFVDLFDGRQSVATLEPEEGGHGGKLIVYQKQNRPAARIDGGSNATGDGGRFQLFGRHGQVIFKQP